MPRGELFENFIYFGDFLIAGVHVFNELDISIAGLSRIGEQVGQWHADGAARSVSDGTGQQAGEANDAN